MVMMANKYVRSVMGVFSPLFFLNTSVYGSTSVIGSLYWVSGELCCWNPQSLQDKKDLLYGVRFALSELIAATEGAFLFNKERFCLIPSS